LPLRFADFILILDNNGVIAAQGDASSMRLENLHVQELLNNQTLSKTESQSGAAALIAEELPIPKPAQANLRNPKLDTNHRGRGDLTLYKFYFRSIGWWNLLITLLFVSSYVFCYAFQRESPILCNTETRRDADSILLEIWLQWWTTANRSDNTRYLSIYLSLAFAAVAFLGLFIW